MERTATKNRVVLFGCGKIGKEAYHKLTEEGILVEAFIDNDNKKQNEKFEGKVPIISLDEYKTQYKNNCAILITSIHGRNIIKQLEQNNINNYSVYPELWLKKDEAWDEQIAHTRWPAYLKNMCDKTGNEILEVGSRIVTGANFRELFTEAKYTGFDYYAGENVDVVGDAHELTKYFDKKFDLIFSSAVLEHLAMPWKAAIEMIKLLKPGGYIFIETHYSYSRHEVPWHFFQFSENSLQVLFPEKFGIKCIKKCCSNPLEARFSPEYASDYLKGEWVKAMYCHSEFLGCKIAEMEDYSWDNVRLQDVAGSSRYPEPHRS